MKRKMAVPFPWLDDKAINHLLVKDFPEAVYESGCSEVKECNVISSVDIFNYTYPLRRNLYKNFIIDINSVLRNGETPTNDIKLDIESLSNIILSAPSIEHRIIVWRGLSVVLDCKPGDILTNLGFMYCSFNRQIAKFYQNNTLPCYDRVSKRINCERVKKLKVKGTLLKIIVPSGTKMLDTSGMNICVPSVINSEIVFNHTVQLKVIKPTKNYLLCKLITKSL